MLIAMEYEDCKQELALGHYGLYREAYEGSHLPLRICPPTGKGKSLVEVEGHIDQFPDSIPNAGWATHFPPLKQREVIARSRLKRSEPPEATGGVTKLLRLTANTLGSRLGSAPHPRTAVRS
jgi:hypothetical protein